MRFSFLTFSLTDDSPCLNKDLHLHYITSRNKIILRRAMSNTPKFDHSSEVLEDSTGFERSRIAPGASQEPLNNDTITAMKTLLAIDFR